MIVCGFGKNTANIVDKKDHLSTWTEWACDIFCHSKILALKINSGIRPSELKICYIKGLDNIYINVLIIITTYYNNNNNNK